MKFLQIFKNPCLLAFCIAIILTGIGYFGIRACAYLDTRFPEPIQNGDWSYFGHFDMSAACCYMLFFVGVTVGVISLLGLLVAAIIFLFRRRQKICRS